MFENVDKLPALDENKNSWKLKPGKENIPVFENVDQLPALDENENAWKLIPGKENRPVWMNYLLLMR